MFEGDFLLQLAFHRFMSTQNMKTKTGKRNMGKENLMTVGRKKSKGLQKQPLFHSSCIFPDARRIIHESQLLTKYVHENLRRKVTPVP